MVVLACTENIPLVTHHSVKYCKKTTKSMLSGIHFIYVFIFIFREFIFFFPIKVPASDIVVSFKWLIQTSYPLVDGLGWHFYCISNAKYSSSFNVELERLQTLCHLFRLWLIGGDFLFFFVQRILQETKANL